jgi:hypothetical protein
MQVHRITLLVEDFDGLGAEEIRQVIENQRFPNRCISPQVLSSETREIGEWHDDHPLNYKATRAAEIARLFGARES